MRKYGAILRMPRLEHSAIDDETIESMLTHHFLGGKKLYTPFILNAGSGLIVQGANLI